MDKKEKLKTLWILANKAINEGRKFSSINIYQQSNCFIITIGDQKKCLSLSSFCTEKPDTSKERNFLKLDGDFLKAHRALLREILEEDSVFFEGKKTCSIISEKERDKVDEIAKTHRKSFLGFKKKKPIYEVVKGYDCIKEYCYTIIFGSISEKFTEEEYEEIKKVISDNKQKEDLNTLNKLLKELGN